MIKRFKFSAIFSLIILYLSLTGSDKFEKVTFLNIPCLDKIVHFGMYFTLMALVIFETRKSITKNMRLILPALFPFFYGILMEILQTLLTDSRQGSIYDVVFNTAGIIASILVWLWIKTILNDKIR